MDNTQIAKFWARVAIAEPDACWIWQGPKANAGNPKLLPYGQLNLDGKLVRAHRLAWQLTNGAIPEGMHVLHRCDNAACANPAHLFLGTPGRNMQDKVEKGRQARQYGSANGNAKLSETDIADIRARYKAGERQAALAREYRVGRMQISRIVRCASWK